MAAYMFGMGRAMAAAAHMGRVLHMFGMGRVLNMFGMGPPMALAPGAQHHVSIEKCQP
jgi:hypothetical protein